MLFDKRHPQQLWAWITKEGEVIDTAIINEDVYGYPMPPQFRFMADSPDLELLKSIENHLLEGRIKHYGTWRTS